MPRNWEEFGKKIKPTEKLQGQNTWENKGTGWTFFFALGSELMENGE